jgi:hypothetical protein
VVIDHRCRELIRDLDQVVWKTDAHGIASTKLDKFLSRKIFAHTPEALKNGSMRRGGFVRSRQAFRNG